MRKYLMTVRWTLEADVVVEESSSLRAMAKVQGNDTPPPNGEFVLNSQEITRLKELT